MHLNIVEHSADHSSLSDAQLIEAALAGVEDAYSEIMRRHKDRLVTSIRGDVNCSESAEDIVQDAFVRAFSKLHLFRCESSLYTWLYRIALNSRRYYMRNRHRTMQLDAALDRPDFSWVAPQTTPEDVVEGREEREQVRAALARLEAHHRTILMLREFEGCDYQAISEALDVTLGTVRSRLSRARAQLRKELDAYWTSTEAGEVPDYGDQSWPEHALSLTA